jgi:uncharacterized membrane protein YhaH (DUF805 family)
MPYPIYRLGSFILTLLKYEMKKAFGTLFAFRGRVGRVQLLLVLAIWFPAYIYGIRALNPVFGSALDITIAVLPWWILFSQVLRRCHDIGFSSWELITGLIYPLYNLYFVFILIFQEGEEDENDWGQKPSWISWD